MDLTAIAASASEIVATALFALAVLHTFSVSLFQRRAVRYRQGSIGENFFHLLGEVEIAFGLWAGALVAYLAVFIEPQAAIEYLESRNFTEPLFVFVVMVIAATRPIIVLVHRAIAFAARILPLPSDMAFYAAALTLGPLLGSVITEPAAMTVTALVLKDRFFQRDVSLTAKYITLGVLFVNVSIGGVLTHFAAPPVLMVAQTWHWDSLYMLTHFGWKAALAVLLNTIFAVMLCRRELTKENTAAVGATAAAFGTAPGWLVGLHVLFLGSVVFTSHYSTVFLGLFLFFLGLAAITQEYQDELKLRESLLVAFFLGGLVVLGGMQEWWLAPTIQALDAGPLFVGSVALTAITDNAALTYLGSQVEGITDALKYALVAGAVAGGGLTVIANAPNPVGFAILRDNFADNGISALRLLIAALLPTAIAMACFWWL